MKSECSTSRRIEVFLLHTYCLAKAATVIFLKILNGRNVPKVRQFVPINLSLDKERAKVAWILY